MKSTRLSMQNRPALLLSTLFALPFGLCAQKASQASDTNEMVANTSGYRLESVTTATRTNTPSTDIPPAVATVTSGFRNDTGSGSFSPDRPPPPGPVPGVIIDRSPDPARVYLGSPAIAILPNGSYVASHDWFGPGTGYNSTVVFSSNDRGLTWKKISEINGQFWSSLFVNRDELFIIGTSGLYGNVVIRRSIDGGVTWTAPTDAKSGLLLAGRYHTAPVPVLKHNGRLWRGFEAVVGSGGWPRHFQAMVLSVSESSDLLDAANWVHSDALEFDATWMNAKRPGWLEGNMVLSGEGQVMNILRLETEPSIEDVFSMGGGAANIPRYEVAAVGAVSGDGTKLSFNPANGFVHFPGAQSKFTIRYDIQTQRYWSLIQKITNPYSGYDWDHNPNHQRNVLVLTSSSDLRTWREERVILRYREGRVINKDSGYGFQYVDWQFDGADLIAVCRTAWAAHNFHDANFLTFHRVLDFRVPQSADSTPDLAEQANSSHPSP